jgi:hypothetical protein
VRVKVDYSTASLKSYKDFCKTHPEIDITGDEWRVIIYTYVDMFKQYMLETGEKARLPNGLGEFFINKKKRKKFVCVDGVERIALPVDWKKTKEKGKKVYNFNFHTDGYFFGWKWMKKSTTFRFSSLWNFKPTRVTSRLLAHYLKADEKYQHIYREWLTK